VHFGVKMLRKKAIPKPDRHHEDEVPLFLEADNFRDNRVAGLIMYLKVVRFHDFVFIGWLSV